MVELPAHLESFLGTIEAGWSTGPDGEWVPFQVVSYTGGVVPSTRSLSTLGLSNSELQMRGATQSVRLVFLMMVDETRGNLSIPALLQQVGLRCLDHGNAPLRGEVLGPAVSLFDGYPFEALYVAAPVYLPDAFASCEAALGEVNIAWLIPIYASEATFIEANGWKAFEHILIASELDMVDLNRPAAV